ncbi:MAG: hypothetical protein Q8N89_04860 [Azonexus sp.]|nr:hypothetical protein [Azonexus sp.]
MKKPLWLLLTLTTLPLMVQADAGSVTIVSPADNATLSAKAENKITYDVAPGPQGDHTHLYVNGKEVAILRQLKGSHALASLAPGAHEICIKVVNKNHTPIGIEKCIKVKVE